MTKPTMSLEEALKRAAQLAARDQDFLPVFERIEREIMERDRQNTALDRAKALAVRWLTWWLNR